jgi:hypothetical protein
MFNIKSSSLWLASVALLLILATPAARAAGMAPAGNFVSVRINGAHVAYGAILSPTKILVPAHIGGGALSTMSILAGAPDRTVTTCGTCQLRAVQSFVRHPNYNSGGAPFGNDVAVIHVSALSYNANVFGSTIAAPFSNAVGTQFTQIGYESGGTNHNRLQTTATSPWTLATMPGYVYTPGAFVTATTDTTLNGMVSYAQGTTQTYTKLSDYTAWINAN